MNVFIDIETYCELDLSEVGVYKYTQHPSFEILLFSYAIDSSNAVCLDLTDNYIEDYDLIADLLKGSNLHAHNANFERVCLNAAGFKTTPDQWSCTMIKAAYCGLPLGLDEASNALGLTGKLEGGKNLVTYFCKPCKPTKINGGRTRNLATHDPEKWIHFKGYNIQDVIAEREIDRALSKYNLPSQERELYALDQRINDAGIEIDLDFAAKAAAMDDEFKQITIQKIKDLTGVDNPNSLPQLKKWIYDQTGKQIDSLNKDVIDPIIESFGAGVVSDVLNLRKLLGKTSVKKYTAMLNSACEDNRSRGLFQFYGANRTGRWAGRLIQLQNLPRNTMKDLDLARQVVKEGDLKTVELLFGDVPGVLSQLVRTAFIPGENNVFAVADFSAIEARVIAWLASEQWRLEVFATHGKIYEASASKMFKVPLEQITKGSDLRQKGKIAELALGYQGSVGAMLTMGADKMGLSEPEMAEIVDYWRASNPKIVQLWLDTDELMKTALKNPGMVFTGKPPAQTQYYYDGHVLQVKLPSGRKLFYQNPQFTINKFKQQSIRYKGIDQETKQWGWVDSYGGKWVENQVQAIARDLLAYSMLNLDKAGYDIAMHVHDEVVIRIQDPKEFDKIIELMIKKPAWAATLPLSADGYLTNYYKKD